MPTRFARLELYSIHAHISKGLVDYLDLLTKVANPIRGYHTEQGKRQVVIGNTDLVGTKLFMVSYTGYAAKTILFFDVSTGQELPEATGPGRFQARKTHIMIDGKKRLLLLDAKKGNLSASDLALIIEEVAHRLEGYESLELSFNPIADTDFIKEIDNLKRIKRATVTIGRPNTDWTDWNYRLTEVADESNAGAMDVTARAKRNQSLTKDSGLVKFVKVLVGTSSSIFKRVLIVGMRDEDAGLTTLNLSKHVEHVNIAVDENPDTGQPVENEVRKRMTSYLDSRDQ